jgi:hypothetical protein
MVTLLRGGGLMKENLSKKLLCLGTNGLNVFQSAKQELPNKSRIHGHPSPWVYIVLFVGPT